MNGLTLRISSTGKNKIKPTATFNTVCIPDNLATEIAKKNEKFKEFIKSNEKKQLELLRELSYPIKYDLGTCNELDTLELFAIVFLYSESKHPAQCFVLRFVSNKESLLEPFTEALIKQIDPLLSREHSSYTCYKSTVEQICCCIDNEPGSIALRALEVQVMEYLNNCLVCCVGALRENNLDSVDKNDLFAIVHTTFRILLFLVQKISDENHCTVDSMLSSIESSVVELLKELETPMDTKSVGSILFVTLYIKKNRPDSWQDIIGQPNNEKLSEILANESVKLSLVSGVATVVSTPELYSTLVNDEAAMLTLTDAIIRVGETMSCDTVVLLGVARALCAVSRTLGDSGRWGVPLVGKLLPFVWAHLEHSVDSVGHLCATALGNIVGYCVGLNKKGDGAPLSALVTALRGLERTRKSLYLGVSALAKELGAVTVLQLMPGLIEQTLDLLNFQPVQASALNCLDKLLESHVRSAPRAAVQGAWLAPLLRAAARDASPLPQRLLVRAAQLDTDLLDYIMDYAREVCDADDLSSEELKQALTLLAVCRKCGAFIEDPLDKDDATEEGNEVPESEDNDTPENEESCAPEGKDAHESKDNFIHLHHHTYKSHGTKDSKPELKEVTPEDLDEALESDDDKWKGVLSYTVLDRAALDPLQENRVLALSLVSESPRSTEPLSARELHWALRYMSHNIAAQSPNFRHHVMGLVKKLLSRVEEGYAALRRARRPARHCLAFIEKLIAVCFRSLLPGANYGRRQMALQVLTWICDALTAPATDIKLESINQWVYRRPLLAQDHSDAKLPGLWRQEYIEILLQHLDDSYDTNKRMALEMLHKCPIELFTTKYSTSLDFSDILQQASSVRPSECVAAAHKMELLLYRLPDAVPAADSEATVPAQYVRYPVRHRAVIATLSVVRAQLQQLRMSLLHARDAPLHGVLHVLRTLLLLRPGELSFLSVLDENPQWRVVTEEILELCYEVSAVVAPVVNSASPEGHLPMDATPLEDSDGVVQFDGRHVTAQMVLLCAWRTVREVSLILGHIASQVWSWSTEPANLPLSRLYEIGAHFTSLLTELKHRGAFEQAYVGYTVMLASLWKHREPPMREIPAAWLDQLMDAIASGETNLCATRRSAGLPFMIQALVTTELAAGGRRWAECVTRLLRLGSTGAADTRVHCANVLRALFRCGALHDHLAPHAPAALLLALRGFRADTWSERNSSTLLFAALVVWTFGVQRSRDADALCSRNTMTGRMFFQRFPQLYDHMLNELREMTSAADCMSRGAQFPVLLLLARLHPSPLEGTATNLKVSSFVPLVRACGAGAARAARRLAARALPPLLAPGTYLPAILEMLSCACDARQRTNYRHGTILQLTKIFEAKADILSTEELSDVALLSSLRAAVSLLRQARGAKPCYVLADDYIKMINSVVARYYSLLDSEFVTEIRNELYELLFVTEKQKYHPGMQLCLANAASTYFVLTHILDKTHEILDFVHKCLKHDIYEVVLSALNYLLIVNNMLEIEDKFQEHLKVLCEKSNMATKLVIGEQIFEDLEEILKTNRYLECQQKALQVLTLNEGTQEYIIRGKNRQIELTDGAIIDTLTDFIETEHENFTHNYLQSLTSFVSKRMSENAVDDKKLLEIIRTIFACTTSDNSEETRTVVVQFMESSYKTLFDASLDGLKEDERFEFRAILYSTLIMIVEDESPALCQRGAGVVGRVTGSALASAELMMESIRDVAMYTLLALLDFRTVVQMSDVNDECRVFDQNERHNAYFEETFWTRTCVEAIKRTRTVQDPVTFVKEISQDPRYKAAFTSLCGDNVDDIITERSGSDVNPKLRVFIDTFMS
ncbi:uncharacterized protein LOC121734811 [Aricia agestis]|uniref:uncharacterized protein LOC121734811 n=1 Tax=Aricia agestis TaxID=91739 RepID=UPI001C201E2E|nr:uncharacterized protein LOC121734811 [Aricia agestis]